MSTATPSSGPIETIADLVARLGGIPLERIRFHPPPGSATEQDALVAAEREPKHLCELIDGVLVEKDMGLPEAFLASQLLILLNEFVRPKNLGIVVGADGLLRLFSGCVRIPDVTYISWDRLPNRRIPSTPVPSIAPDLAVEVLSKGNTPAEMEMKRDDYFKAGVRLVWQVIPKSRTVEVYTGVDDVTTLTDADILDGGVVLPGFTLRLCDLFAELDRKG